jgi:hypothetical protein
MCMQCMAGAMTAGAAATGMRSWLVLRAGAWLTPRRRVLMTRALVAGGLVAAALVGPSAA